MTDDRALRVLFICTANVCRSPLAHALMKARAAAGGYSVKVASASVQQKVRPVHPLVETILGERGQRPARPESRPLSSGLAGAADIILTMTGAHAIAVASAHRQARFKTFMLDHFVKVARPMRPGETVDAWIAEMRRLPRSYPNQPGSIDVPDPVDKDEATFRSIADEIDWLVGEVTGLLVPGDLS